jgi:hypothetical protein
MTGRLERKVLRLYSGVYAGVPAARVNMRKAVAA